MEFFPSPQIILQIGEIKFYTYGAMYALGAVEAYFLIPFFAKIRGQDISKEDILDFIFWTILGGVLGGRIFDMLVYNFSIFLNDPIEIFRVWHGGMSIHGGLIGGSLGAVSFLRIKKISFWKMADIITPSLAIGLALGRIGNFVNGELYGRITDVSWAMDFGDGNSRHPSQLYAVIKDFFLGGICTFLLLKEIWKKESGKIFAFFLIGYGILRFLVEFVREPDSQIGFFFGWMTIGQILSLGVIGIGITFFFLVSKKQNLNDH